MHDDNPTNPPLARFRQRLARLGRARRWRRWLCGASIFVSATVVILSAMFVVDVLFALDALQRVTVALLGSATLLAVVLRRVRPYLAVREGEVDLAILVQRLHGIDTDLVAAIEFARPSAAAWGSAALRGAVIRQVENRGCELDLSGAVDRRTARRNLWLLVLIITLFASVAALLPAHMLTFWRRLAGSDEHYPSRTRVSRIEVNGQVVLGRMDAATPRNVSCAEQAPVRFLVRCQRRPPATGELLIRESGGAETRRVPLVRDHHADPSARPGEVLFTAQLSALRDSLQYQVFLGDAWTNPAEIEMIPLPQVELRMAVEPPAYARSRPLETPAPGAYRTTVLEGSRVDLTLQCVNGKRLHHVWADVSTPLGQLRRELIAKDEEAASWELAGATCEPLASVVDVVRFDLSVEDEDGLRPLRLPSGEIRVRADLPPEALTATIHRLVLPAARPTVAYRVTDDFGIGRLRLQVQIERADDADENSADAETTTESHFVDLDGIDYPLLPDQLPYRGRHTLELSPWQLKKGDRLKVTLAATDYRAAVAGASVVSQPVYWEVSDEAGVLAAILAADQRTEQDLDEMIERQMGLGEEP